jgi:hypothetical protein
MSGSRLIAFLCVVLLAGCTFGVADTEPLAPGVDSEADTPLTLANHTLDIDGEQVFERTSALVGEDVTPPPVRVIDPTTSGQASTTISSVSPAMPSEFADDLGLLETSEGTGYPAGFTDRQGFVYLVAGSGPEAVMEQILVHEYVHSIQFRSSMLPWPAPTSGAPTTDAYLTRMSLVEGGAVYVADAYTREHGPEEIRLQSRQMAEGYAGGAPGDRFLFAPYHFGSDYFEAVLDSPAEFRSLYETPPNTTTHVLHDHPPGERLAGQIPANVTASGTWELRDPDGSDTLGEMAIRVALSGAVGEAAAAEAATGWRGDRLYAFDTGSETGFAWTVQFSDPSNASAFRGAVETLADQREREDRSFRTVALEDRIVVLTGALAFLEASTVSGDETVQITVEPTAAQQLGTDTQPGRPAPSTPGAGVAGVG